VVVQDCAQNLSTQEDGKFKASLGVRVCLKKTKQTNKKKLIL
jgi:hypothetical protein